MVIKSIHTCLFILFILFLGCNYANEEKSPNQKVNLVIEKPELIRVNQKTLIKIFPSQNEWSLVRAYIDCNQSSDTNIDTLNSSIIGCEKELFVASDTILIQFTPMEEGKNKFQDIRILLKRSNDTYLIKDTTFYYSVKRNNLTGTLP